MSLAQGQLHRVWASEQKVVNVGGGEHALANYYFVTQACNLTSVPSVVKEETNSSCFCCWAYLGYCAKLLEPHQAPEEDPWPTAWVHERG